MVSTKGQVVLPAEVRHIRKIKAGTKLMVYLADEEIRMLKTPENPVEAISGIAKHLDIPEDAVKRMRQEDERRFKTKHGV